MNGWILVLVLMIVLIGVCIFLFRNQDTRNYLSHLLGFASEREPVDAKTGPPSTGKTSGKTPPVKTRALGSVIAEMRSNKVQPSTTTDSGYDSDPQTKGRRYEENKKWREELQAL